MNKTEFANRLEFVRLMKREKLNRMPLQMLAPGQDALYGEHFEHRWHYDPSCPLFMNEDGCIYFFPRFNIESSMSSRRFLEQKMILQHELVFYNDGGVIVPEDSDGDVWCFEPTHTMIWAAYTPEEQVAIWNSISERMN